MKKQLLTLLLIITTSVTFGQTAVEIQKAKAASVAYLKRNLNNPGSYKAASWSKLTKTYTDYQDTEVAKNRAELIDGYHKMKLGLMSSIPDLKRKIGTGYETDTTYIKGLRLQEKVESAYDSLSNANIAAEKVYKGKFNGYSIEHSFRARNKFNALILQTHIFILNKNFKVISSGDTEEIERERQDLLREIDEFTNGES